MGWYTDIVVFVVFKNFISEEIFYSRIRNFDVDNDYVSIDDIYSWFGEDIINKYQGHKILFTTKIKRGGSSDMQYLVELVQKVFIEEFVFIYGGFSGEDGYAHMQLEDSGEDMKSVMMIEN